MPSTCFLLASAVGITSGYLPSASYVVSKKTSRSRPLSPRQSFLDRRKRRRVPANANAEEPEPEEPDYLVTDSVGLPDAARPALWKVLANPRDGVALALLALGGLVAACNVAGSYGDTYLALEEAAIALGG